MKAYIVLQEKVKPVFQRAQPVSYALKKPLEESWITLRNKEF